MKSLETVGKLQQYFWSVFYNKLLHFLKSFLKKSAGNSDLVQIFHWHNVRQRPDRHITCTNALCVLFA